MNNLKISITDFVGFLSRKGNISSEFTNTSSSFEGIQLHQMIQKTRPSHYQKEIHLSFSHNFNDEVILTLSGRADGIFQREDHWYIEEIKSTASDKEFIQVDACHLAQAQIYAYIYLCENSLESISVQMTYIQTETKEETPFFYTYTSHELTDIVNALLALFYEFYKIVHHRKTLRNQSLENISFPYDSFRQGQKEMAVSCFKAIKNKEILFIQAPTGIGKTLSTLYPAIQALGKHTSKIMYLTAKTITRQVAVDTVELMKSTGLVLSYVVLTAKEKICFLDKPQCHPDLCPFANGHYDRINNALLDLLTNEDTYTRKVIETYAKKHQVCPFELSLDLFNFSDISISDYNYAFDPKVNLKRAFETNNDYVLLVDEAHNLVDRSRQMYSASIDFQKLKQAKKVFKPKKGKLYRSLKKVVNELENIDQKEQFIQKELPEPLISIIEQFLQQARKEIAKMDNSELKDLLIEIFFMLNDVSRIVEYYSDSFITYYENKILKLFCLDASSCLRPIYKKCQSVILFSATLLPISYFFSLNGGQLGDKKLYFTSPFPKENLELLVASDIKTTYQYRSSSYQQIVDYIYHLLQSKQGHYLIFFPSYAYLLEIANRMKDIDIFIQKSQMNEDERESFLKEFETETDKSKLFFCVLGGIFSEGIDLKGDQVIGIVIVTVGLPQICLERELIKEYFQKDNLGYNYAYVYPGFNKVLQAAGRLIRTPKDRGVVLLLDHRYLTNDYISMYPQEWNHFKSTNSHIIDQQLSDFHKSE